MTTSYKLNDGASIPWLAIGSGTAHFGKDATAAVAQALRAGITHLDAAQIYRNEASVGEAIAQSGVPRASLFLTTKLGPLPAGKTVRDTLVESLAKLQVEYVDLFLIHAPFQHPGRVVEVWKDMEECKKEGLAKSIGVSNAMVKDLEKILESGSIVPAVNQVCIPLLSSHLYPHTKSFYS